MVSRAGLYRNRANIKMVTEEGRYHNSVIGVLKLEEKPNREQKEIVWPN